MKWKQRRILLHDVPQLELLLDVPDVGDNADDVILTHLHRDILPDGNFIPGLAGVEQISCTERRSLRPMSS